VSARAEAYAQDGVVCARGLLDAGWVARLRAAVDRAMAAPSNDAMEFNAEGEAGRFFGDMFMHRRDADFRAAFFDSPCAALAGEAMDAAEVRLLYDQIFAKMPGTPRRTPWHQDGPYWPLSGDRLCTVYVALDPIDATSGAVAYARGSHRAEAFRPAPFRAGADAAARYAQSALPELAAPDPESLIAFDLAPGDAVVFTPISCTAPAAIRATGPGARSRCGSRARTCAGARASARSAGCARRTSPMAHRCRRAMTCFRFCGAARRGRPCPGS